MRLGCQGRLVCGPYARVGALSVADAWDGSGPRASTGGGCVMMHALGSDAFQTLLRALFWRGVGWAWADQQLSSSCDVLAFHLCVAAIQASSQWPCLPVISTCFCLFALSSPPRNMQKPLQCSTGGEATGALGTAEDSTHHGGSAVRCSAQVNSRCTARSQNSALESCLMGVGFLQRWPAFDLNPCPCACEPNQAVSMACEACDMPSTTVCLDPPPLAWAVCRCMPK